MDIFQDFEYTISQNNRRREVTIHKYLGNKKYVIVPATIETIAVTTLTNTFTKQAEIENIELPRYLKVINKDTFRDCKNLKSITLPPTMDSILANSFKNCVSLEKISFYKTPIFHENIIISQGTFENCPKLYNAEGVFTQITYFWGYNGSNPNITIPFGLKKIGEYTFAGNNTIETVTIPDSVSEIGAGAFSNCEKLREITWGLGVKKIGDYAFTGNKTIDNVTIPDSVLEIGADAFSNCEKLGEITLGLGVKIIGQHAFAENKTIETVTIPDSVSEIGDDAFSNCEKLREITIPTSLPTIRADTFAQCSSLEKVMFSHKTKSTYYQMRLVRGTFSYSGQLRKYFLKTGEELHPIVLNSLVAQDYEQYNVDLLSNWSAISQNTRNNFLSGWNQKIENNKDIGRNRFRNWVFYQQTAKEMKVYFEAGCHLELPELELYLEHCINEGKTAETAILLEYKRNNFDETYLESELSRKEMLDFGLQPLNINELSKNWAFYKENECIIITGYLGENTSEILPDYVKDGMHILRFEKSDIGFSVLQQLFLPEGLEIIGAETFLQTSLEEVYIPSTVKEIEYMAFAESELRTFTFTFTKTKIILNPRIFSDCKRLEKVIFTETIPEIPHAMFFHCFSLKEIILPMGLDKIGRKAFSTCHSLEKIQFPNTLTFVDTFAFEECTSLEEIELPKSIERLNSKVFFNCTALKKVILSNEEIFKNIQKRAFLGCNSLKFIGVVDGKNLLDKFSL